MNIENGYRSVEFALSTKVFICVAIYALYFSYYICLKDKINTSTCVTDNGLQY